MIEKIFGAETWFNIIGTGDKWLVFLHGWGTNSNCFSEYVNTFKDDFKILLIDFPPFGKSKEPTEPWTLNAYVEMVKKIFDKCYVDNPTIVAHSFGGRVAILLASRYNNIHKLVLFGSAGLKPKFDFKVFAKKCVSKICHFFKIKSPKWLGSADYKVLSQVMKKTFSSVVLTHLDGNCKLVTCPTLLIWGQKDDATPLEMGKRMNKLISSSGLFVIKNAGHFAFITHSQIFINALKCFVSKD
ncbi:MAG: alpha/beta hydrolase [Clostridia bacterium]